MDFLQINLSINQLDSDIQLNFEGLKPILVKENTSQKEQAPLAYDNNLPAIVNNRNLFEETFLAIFSQTVFNFTKTLSSLVNHHNIMLNFENQAFMDLLEQNSIEIGDADEEIFILNIANNNLNIQINQFENLIDTNNHIAFSGTLPQCFDL